MDQTPEEQLRRRIAALEAENARLRDALEFVKAERRELRERVYGPVREENIPTEEELIELMKNHVPGSGLKFFAELGIYPKEPS